MWPLVGKVSLPIDEFTRRMLHRGDGIAVAIISKVFDGLRAKRKREKKKKHHVDEMDSA